VRCSNFATHQKEDDVRYRIKKIVRAKDQPVWYEPEILFKGGWQNPFGKCWGSLKWARHYAKQYIEHHGKVIEDEEYSP
jgi:hypothetical protein